MKKSQANEISVDVYNSIKRMKNEGETTLPDYCSDIARVIRAESTPCIRTKKVYQRDGAAVCDVSGETVFDIIYLTDGGAVECYSFTSEFFDSTKIAVSGCDADSVCVFVKPSCENTVCKVQSPRRVSVRCELALDVKAMANKSFDTFSKGESPVETVERTVSGQRMASSCDALFKLTKEIRLPKSCPPMERILSSRVRIIPEGVSVGDNCADFWGNALFYCTYLAEEESGGTIESFCQPIEIKGNVELEDSRRDMSARIVILPLCPECEIASDELGENRVMKLDVGYSVSCLAEENFDMEITEDIYGVGARVSPIYEKREMKSFAGTLSQSTAIKEKFPLKKGIEAIEDMRARAVFKDTYFENGELFANTRIEISGIGITPESPMGISESFDVSLHLSLPSEVSAGGGDLIFDADQWAGFADVRLDGEEYAVAFDVMTLASIYRAENVSYVASADISEEKSEESGMVFYYPAEGDTLWSIGKRYGAARETLAEMNGIDGEEIKRVIRIK